jgi:hypothetical protein
MGLRSASSSSEHWRSSLSSSEEEDVACAAPLGDNGSMGRGMECYVRMGFIVGCKSRERKGAMCEDGVFCCFQELGEEEGMCENGVFVGCKSGERRRGRWEEGGYLWLEEPIQPLLKKLLPNRLE